MDGTAVPKKEAEVETQPAAAQAPAETTTATATATAGPADEERMKKRLERGGTPDAKPRRVAQATVHTSEVREPAAEEAEGPSAEKPSSS